MTRTAPPWSNGRTAPSGYLTALALSPLLLLLWLVPETAHAEEPAPSPEPRSWTMNRIVSWGYGCGGHCAFNTHGEASVALTLTGEAAVVVDTGEETRDASYPDGTTTETKKWGYRWAGTSSRRGDITVLSLRLDDLECSVTNDPPAGAATACQPPDKKIELQCATEVVPLEKGSAKAFVCRFEPVVDAERPFIADSTALGTATPLPWIFHSPPATVRHIGEPHPITSVRIDE